MKNILTFILSLTILACGGQISVIPANQTVNATSTAEYQEPSDVVLNFDTSNLTTMFTTTSVGNDANTAPTVGSVVGHAYSISNGGFYCNTTSNSAGKPTLTSDGLLSWGATLLRMQTSTTLGMRTYMAGMYKVTPAWGMRFKASSNSDGTSAILFFTRTTSGTTSAGITIQKTSGNKIQIIMGDGTNNMINYTMTQSWLASQGITWFQINVSGTSGTIYMKTTSGSIDISEGFSVAANGSTADTSSDLTFGAANIAIGHIKLLNRVWTSDEITAFKTYAPALNTNYWYAPRVKFDYDLSAYSETTLTTPSTNNGIVRALKNLVTYPTSFSIPWVYSATADGSSPIYKTSAQNGHAGVDYDGTETMKINLMATPGGLFPENNGRWIHFLVAKNRDADIGSHWGTGQNYFVWTGEDYPGSGLVAGPYETMHGISASAGGLLIFPNGTGQSTHIVAHVRKGSQMDHWLDNLTMSSAYFPNTFIITGVGDRYSSVAASFATDGQEYYREAGAGHVPGSYIIYRMNTLKAVYRP